jgi:hypothetical protein
MSVESTENKDNLKQYIQESLQNAELNASRSRRFNSFLLITSILTASATTMVTAVTAATGPIIGEGTEGWKISCIIAAALGFVTTVCVGINQAFSFAQRLSRLNECAGRLRALEVSMKTGRAHWDDIATEYAAIVRDFTEEIRRR